MPKDPLQFSIQDQNSQQNSKEKYNEASNHLINFTSLDEIEWVTTVIEPEQQRGPSENP